MTPGRRLRPRPRTGAGTRSMIQHSGKAPAREEHRPAAATTAHHERQYP